MAPNYLHQVTVENADRGAELFPFLRDGLFEELGVSYPDFCFVSDATLKPNSFTFTINLPGTNSHGWHCTRYDSGQ